MYIDSHLKTVSLSGILSKKLRSILNIPFSNDGSIAESSQVGNTTDNKPGQAESNFCNDKVSIALEISAISLARLCSTSCIKICWTATCAFLQLNCCPTNPAESSKLGTVGSSDNSTNLSDVEACNIYNKVSHISSFPSINWQDHTCMYFNILQISSFSAGQYN